MSRKPEDSANISSALQTRVKNFISDEDCDGGKCSNSDFAKRVGVSKNVISNITNYGIVPSVRSLIKIADYLNVSILYLLGECDDRSFEPSQSRDTFSNRLLFLQKEKNIKISDITNSGSYSRNSIHVWIKRDNIPSLDYLRQIAEFFNVSIDYLLGRTDNFN